MASNKLVYEDWINETEERTHNALEPSPYWPESGQAQMTCNAELVAFTDEAFRVIRVFNDAVDSRTGMTSRLSLEQIALGQPRQREQWENLASVGQDFLGTKSRLI